MPMIGCGNGDGVNILPFEYSPEVAKGLGLCVWLQPLQGSERCRKMFFVPVTQCNDLHIRQCCEPVHVIVPHSSQTDVGHAHLVAGCSQQVGNESDSNSRKRTAPKELASVDVARHEFNIVNTARSL